jgi:uncharacterized protein (DUF4415 family)
MKDEYDFSEGKRGPVLPLLPGQVRVNLRLDEEVLAWFRDQIDAANGGSYSALINAALRDYISKAAAGEDGEPQPPRAA